MGVPLRRAAGSSGGNQGRSCAFLGNPGKGLDLPGVRIRGAPNRRDARIACSASKDSSDSSAGPPGRPRLGGGPGWAWGVVWAGPGETVETRRGVREVSKVSNDSSAPHARNPAQEGRVSQEGPGRVGWWSWAGGRDPLPPPGESVRIVRGVRDAASAASRLSPSLQPRATHRPTTRSPGPRGRGWGGVCLGWGGSWRLVGTWWRRGGVVRGAGSAGWRKAKAPSRWMVVCAWDTSDSGLSQRLERERSCRWSCEDLEPTRSPGARQRGVRGACRAGATSRPGWPRRSGALRTR